MKRNTLIFEITTRILSYDFQPGMKSKQDILIDFEKKTIRSKYITGKTKFAGREFDSINDKFVVNWHKFINGGVMFSVTGRTATAFSAGKLPSIDYNFIMFVDPEGTGEMALTHDAYPAYFIDRISPTKLPNPTNRGKLLSHKHRIFQYYHPHTKKAALDAFDAASKAGAHGGVPVGPLPPFYLALPHIFTLLADESAITRNVKFDKFTRIPIGN